AATLADPRLNVSGMMGMQISIAPDMTVSEGDTLSCGNMTMRFVMTPGHSPGGMCIIMEGENVVFSGDTLFCQSIGRTDFPGCSYEALISSVREKLFTLPDETKVYPGHMGDTQIGFEKKYNPFF
ncbi:MAG: MBL fold metallo-hydrolase, partial [Anaerovoracaceae bacterium]|nr:MBL fold metallo-hydrolase [Anaerovoracaceae bacterium]